MNEYIALAALFVCVLCAMAGMLGVMFVLAALGVWKTGLVYRLLAERVNRHESASRHDRDI